MPDRGFGEAERIGIRIAGVAGDAAGVRLSLSRVGFAIGSLVNVGGLLVPAPPPARKSAMIGAVKSPVWALSR